MRTFRQIVPWAAVVFLGVMAPSPAGAQVDRGLASSYPWSGSWWPHKQGGLTAPLTKYDQVTGGHAARWEYDVHVATNPEDWFGHCHAWSASSVLEREPRADRQVQQIIFGVGDQKGLLAAAHAADIANTYGDRFGDGNGSEDRLDPSPDVLWRMLQLFLQRQRLPLVLDLEAGEQIWNFPVYQYEVKYAPAGGDWYAGTMTLVAADDNVLPDYVGTQYILRNYTFRVRILNGALVLGSGQWTGTSVQDHPDFAWYPYVAVAENPSIDDEQISKIVGFTVGAPHAAPRSDVNPTPIPTPTPTPTPVNPPTPVPVTPVVIDDVLGPYELVSLVLNRTSHFPFDLFVDRGDGGKYHPGEPVRISVKSGDEGYLYLFDVDSHGTVRLIFPAPGVPNRIEANTLYDLPVPKAVPLLLAEGQGQHNVKGIVTSRPIQITGTRQVSQTQQQRPQQAQRGLKVGLATLADARPQAIVVPPSTEKQMKQLIQAGLQKGRAGTVQAPKKMGRFAQDMCAYFVFGQDRASQTSEPAK